MDLYNCYLMRASGEAKHQAKTKAEKLVFGIWDLIKEESVFNRTGADKEKRSAQMNGLLNVIQNDINIESRLNDDNIWDVMKYLIENVFAVAWESERGWLIKFMKKLSDQMERSYNN